jgi:crossover junction endodeoxyribonuclease RuvC
MQDSVVLGLDPGTRHFGWGVVERKGTRLLHRAHGVVHADERDSIAVRLVAIERALVEIVREHSPSAASVEALFFAKDAQAAAKLGHARGVALLVCARAGLSVHEYAPATVKRAVTGSGRGEKLQVAQMIRVLLGLLALPPADASDALAAAVTHLQHVQALQPVGSGPHRPTKPLGPGPHRPTEPLRPSPSGPAPRPRTSRAPRMQ